MTGTGIDKKKKISNNIKMHEAKIFCKGKSLNILHLSQLSTYEGLLSQYVDARQL